MTDWSNRIVGHDDVSPAELVLNEQNWRTHPAFQQRAMEGVLDQVGWVQQVLVNRRTGRVVDGHLRVELARKRKEATVPVLFVDLDEAEEALVLATLDPISALAGKNEDNLKALMAKVQVSNDAVRAMLAQLQKQDGPRANMPSLADRFVAPPFTVLDARQGYWMERKQQWRAWGVQEEAGRENLDATVVQTEWMQRGKATGGSAFDPVLAEIVYRWFCPAGGRVLDPFAGESTKGLVAAALGFQYLGIELRQEQVEANFTQAAALGVAPQWRCGDSAQLAAMDVGTSVDLVFTSPPYYDLEVYSEATDDGSTMGSYEDFIAWYAKIMKASVARLADNRFAVVKVGDVRDARGGYRNFPGDNVALFREAGLAYYNEAVLVTPVGSMPLRSARVFNAGRKLCKGHQNVLVFYKGDPKQIHTVFGDVVAGAGPDARRATDQG